MCVCVCVCVCCFAEKNHSTTAAVLSPGDGVYRPLIVGVFDRSVASESLPRVTKD